METEMGTQVVLSFYKGYDWDPFIHFLLTMGKIMRTKSQDLFLAFIDFFAFFDFIAVFFDFIAFMGLPVPCCVWPESFCILSFFFVFIGGMALATRAQGLVRA